MQNKTTLQKKPSSTVQFWALSYKTGLRKMGRKNGFQLSNKNNKKTLDLTSLSEESTKKQKWRHMMCKRLLHNMTVIFMSTAARTTTKLTGNSYQVIKISKENTPPYQILCNSKDS